MSRASDALQKEEEVLRFLAAGTQSGGASPDLPNGAALLQKEEGRHLHHKSEENLGELGRAARALAAPEIPGQCPASRTASQGAVLRFTAATRAASAVSFTPGSFTHQIQTAFQDRDLPWALIPGPAYHHST